MGVSCIHLAAAFASLMFILFLSYGETTGGGVPSDAVTAHQEGYGAKEPEGEEKEAHEHVVGIRTTKLPIGQLKLISSPVGNLVFYGHFARSHGLHGPTRHPTAGANRQNDQKRPSCAHGRSANSRYAIQAAKGGHMSRLVRWS